jgi:type 1 glutamine amidotransferase
VTRVLVLGENTFPFHQIDDKRDDFERLLADYEVTVTTDRDALTGEYDVFVDFLTDSTLSESQREALEAHVDGGGGYVGVHCASDLTSRAPGPDDDEVIVHEDEQLEPFRELLGGHFLTHPEQSEFGVHVTADHPVTEGVDDFSVHDEPYQVTVDDEVTVLARMDHPDLEDYPVVWTNESAGRVAYISLGHTEEAFGHEQFGRLLTNAVDWANE